MAGLGRRTFAAGEVLTASNVMGYLQDQAVMNFAGTAARGSAIASPSEGMVSYLADSNVIETYSGSIWERQTGGLIPITPTSITAVSGSASYTALGVVSFSGCSSIMLNGIFTSQFKKYLVNFQTLDSATNALLCRLSTNGTANTSSVYNEQFLTGVDTFAVVTRGASQNRFGLSYSGSYQKNIGTLTFTSPAESVWTALYIKVSARNTETSASTLLNTSIDSVFAGTTTFDGFQFLPNGASTISGDIQVFGFND